MVEKLRQWIVDNRMEWVRQFGKCISTCYHCSVNPQYNSWTWWSFSSVDLTSLCSPVTWRPCRWAIHFHRRKLTGLLRISSRSSQPLLPCVRVCSTYLETWGYVLYGVYMKITDQLIIAYSTYVVRLYLSTPQTSSSLTLCSSFYCNHRHYTLNQKIFAKSKFRKSAPYLVGRKVCD